MAYKCHAYGETNETGAATTTAPIEPGAIGSPEFCRPSDCRHLFGLSRTFVYQLIQDQKIRSVCLRKPGARTGIRLIDVASIREFLTSQMGSQS
jgi:hypothetical protein